MFAAGQAAAKSAAKSESQFAAGTEQLALAAQARFYVYSKQRISKATFNNPEWRNALHAAFEHGGRVPHGAELSHLGAGSCFIPNFPLSVT